MAEINDIEQRLNERIAFAGVTSIEDQDMLALIKEVRRLQTFDNWSVLDHERMQAELETVRRERDALLRERMIFRQALEAVRNRAIDAQGKWAAVVPEHAPMDVWEYKIIAEIGDKAVFEVDELRRIADERNDQPTPQAWTPRLKDRVRINMPDDKNHDVVGEIARITNRSDTDFPYQVRLEFIESGDEWVELEWYKKDNLIPV